MARANPQFSPIPFRELQNQFIQIDKCLEDRVIFDVAAVGTTSNASSSSLPSVATWLNPSNNTGSASQPGITPKLYAATGTIGAGATPTALGGRIFEIACGPAVAAVSTSNGHRLENSYLINDVVVQWDLISGLTAAGAGAAPGDRITFILAKLSSSQTLIDVADVTKSAIGVHYYLERATSATPPGVTGATMIGIDTATCVAALDNASTIAAGRFAFDLTKDLDAGVAGDALTRTGEGMLLSPGERLILIAYSVQADNSALSGAANAVKAWSLKVQTTLVKVRR